MWGEALLEWILKQAQDDRCTSETLSLIETKTPLLCLPDRCLPRGEDGEDRCRALQENGSR